VKRLEITLGGEGLLSLPFETIVFQCFRFAVDEIPGFRIS